MNKSISLCHPLLPLAGVMAAMTICWVAGCAKKSGREDVPETPDTLTVTSDTLSQTRDTLLVTHDTLSVIPTTLADTRDGKTYKIVKIGKQTWMAENLNYKPERGNSWCYEDSCAKYADSAKYGRLYNWNSAISACPTGWHLPSSAEWDTLARFVGGTKDYNNETDEHHWANAGKYLKSQIGWDSYSGIENLDTHGFSALPGGGRYSDDDYSNGGRYSGDGRSGNLWTATKNDGNGAYYRGFSHDLNIVYEYSSYKSYGFSIRCVRDKSAPDASSQKSAGDDRAKIEMVFVKGGTFRMGCTGELGSGCFDDEKPAHSVTVSDFYIGKYEITQNQWVQVMGNPSHFKGDNLPVESVSWNDAQEFIWRLNSITGKKYRLPTEAEWEYAARGGASSKGYKYSGSNNANDVTWYNVNSGDKVLRDGLFEEYVKKYDFDGYYDVLSSNKNRTRAVGTKAPNELGIYDMSGNAWEWVNDWYGEYSSAAQTNPKGPSSGPFQVYRGGGFGNFTGHCRVSFRGYPDGGYCFIGFRLALSP